MELRLMTVKATRTRVFAVKMEPNIPQTSTNLYRHLGCRPPGFDGPKVDSSTENDIPAVALDLCAERSNPQQTDGQAALDWKRHLSPHGLCASLDPKVYPVGLSDDQSTEKTRGEK
jgi:hypothetical protein